MSEDAIEAVRRELTDALSGAELRAAAQVTALRDGVAGELATLAAAMTRGRAEQDERQRALGQRLEEIAGRIDAIRAVLSDLTGWPDAERADGGRLKMQLRKLELGIEQQAEDLRGAVAGLFGRARQPDGEGGGAN